MAELNSDAAASEQSGVKNGRASEKPLSIVHRQIALFEVLRHAFSGCCVLSAVFSVDGEHLLCAIGNGIRRTKGKSLQDAGRGRQLAQTQRRWHYADRDRSLRVQQMQAEQGASFPSRSLLPRNEGSSVTFTVHILPSVPVGIGSRLSGSVLDLQKCNKTRMTSLRRSVFLPLCWIRMSE